ncbi:signal peptidase I [Humidisolicoccus flavus]|uniref:signal peptidase I n=1 Tax=Humidisolicoccus flavus TaxID=3111414 RepID=UPI0032546014
MTDATSRSVTEPPAEPSEQERGSRRSQRGILLFLRDLIVIFLIAILISFLVKTFLIRPFWIPSESMSDTLQVDDRVIVSLLTPDVIPLSHGNIVVFEDPGGWLQDPPKTNEDTGFMRVVDDVLTFIGLAPDNSHGYLIKRVIGLPGDTVACCTDFGQLTINGLPIDEPYLELPDPSYAASGVDFSVTIPEGAVWVMGDNRYRSADSRAHQDDPHGGTVPIDNIVGRAVVVSWPLSHWTWLDSFADVYEGVEEAQGAQ